MESLTQETVRKLFDYRSDGNLIWKIKAANCVHIGDVAGGKKSDGYYVVPVCGKYRTVHRVIFLWHNGYIPDYIDHLDNDKSNNRIENLRPATKSQNGCNRKLLRNNTSGFKGVRWHKLKSKWQSSIMFNSKAIHLGYFSTPEDAYIAYCDAGRKYHGEFFNAG